MSTVRLVTLGGLRLEPQGFPRPKLLLLLAYLSLEQAQPRDHLRELFWSKSADAGANLRVALAQFRADLPGVIEETATLISTGISCDAAALLRAFEATDFAGVVALYTGSFLEGIAPSGLGIELEEWVLTMREFLASRVLEAHLRLAEDALKLSDTKLVERHAIAARHVPGAAPADPDSLLRLHRVFEQINHPFANDLRREADELGLTINRNMQMIIPANLVTPTNLPASVDVFVARDEQNTLKNLLEQPETRLITVTGPGGVGKSRLVLEVARDIQQSPGFAGVFVVFLETLTTTETVVTEILRAVQGVPQSDQDPWRQLTQRLQTKTLLVLDNFEHLMPFAVKLEDLLEACQKLKVIVTSREPLRCAAEWLLRLEGLPVIELAMSNPEAPEHAVELFTRRARRVQPQFSLPKHHQKVLEICRLVQGFPLGIELAAALTRAMPVPELAQALGQHLDVLEGALVNHERHHGIRAVFEHSWKLLKASEQRALARMMVFQGGATRTAASFVMEANLATLVALVDKSLIQASADGRYRVHPLLTQYCNEKLEVNSLESQTAQSRHCEHYLGLLESLLPRLRGSEAQTALEQIEADIENIRSAWLQALNNQQWQCFDQLADLVLFFDRRGRAREGLELFEKTIATLEANPVNPRAEHTARLANYLINAAWLMHCLGQHTPARDRAEQALILARELGASGQQARSKALNTLGSIAKASNDLEAAIRYSQEALESAQVLGDSSREVICLSNLANAESLLGQTPLAKTHYTQAMKLAEHLGDLASVTTTKLSLGHLLLHDPDVELNESRDVLESGFELAVREQILSLQPHFHVNLSEVYLLLGELKIAQQHAETALQLAQAIAEPEVEVEAILGLGRIAHTQGNLEMAQHHYQTSLQLAQGLQDSLVLFDAMLALAELQISTDDLFTAQPALERIVREATPGSWHHRKALRLLKESNLDVSTPFVYGPLRP